MSAQAVSTFDTKNFQQVVQPNRNQVIEHLLGVGHKKGDTVFLRGFYPKDDPRSKEQGSARKAQTKSSDELVRIAKRWQEDGMGVYFVVNGGGQTNEEVKSGRAIFYEHDDLPKEASAILWQQLGLPEPTFQVDTGGKSIHSYWVLDHFSKPEPWRKLQTDLLNYADADRSIKNESRVMRLAGCFHISENGVNPTKIINNSGKRYSFEELRSIIPDSQVVPEPELKPEYKPKIDYVPQTGNVPLSACLTKKDRELIDGGIAEGGRNSNGAKLARNLIGTADKLRELNINFSEEPRILFDSYCRNCTPILDTKEADSIWSKAEKSSPKATLSDDAIQNCVSAWERKQKNANQNKPTGKSFGTQFNKNNSNIEPGKEPSSRPNHTFNQKAFNHFFGDRKWICADNKLYAYEGNYYKEVKDSVLKNKIADFCDNFAVDDGRGNIEYPYANSGHASEVLRWAKLKVIVDPDCLNPPGINCTNGIVRIDWSTGKPVRKLVPHSADEYYTYEPLVKYDPFAETLDCDRLLRCLNESQQQVLLRNLAASLDLKEVRKRRGREVRLILACGGGSNGKDATRRVVSIIYGHKGMTGATVSDFEAYDQGRKFSLASLRLSRVNWASENPKTCRLDDIQSLKAFATGDTLYSEHKGIDPEPYTPMGIGIFNFNNVPPLHGTLQAIQDRIAVVEFTKTFRIKPDPRNPNELQADPRYAYDDDFIKEQVAPAFLNKMLDALEALIEEGIDYDCTTVAFASMQKENNHLFQFCEDAGLQYDTDSQVSAKDLWLKLEQWYQSTGTLTIDENNGRREWIEQVRPSDKNIKGINQVLPRIAALFPKATKTTQYDPISKRNVQVLKGIGFVENTRTTVENFRTSSAPVAAPETPVEQASRTTRTTLSNIQSERDIKEDVNRNQKPVEPQNQKSVQEANQYPPSSGAGGAEVPQNKDSNCVSGAESGAGSVNNGAGNLKKEGDDIYIDNSISLLEIEESEGDVAGFVNMEVEVRSSMNGTVRYSGVLTKYDKLNGSVKITLSSGEVKTHHVREVFVIC